MGGIADKCTHLLLVSSVHSWIREKVSSVIGSETSDMRLPSPSDSGSELAVLVFIFVSFIFLNPDGPGLSSDAFCSLYYYPYHFIKDLMQLTLTHTFCGLLLCFGRSILRFPPPI